MLTIEEIKKELDAGNTVELECIDVDGFLNDSNGRYKKENEETLSSGLIATGVTGSNRIIEIRDWGYSLADDELKYFRIKRPTPSYDDLLGVVVKGCKKGLFIITMDADGFTISKNVRGDTHHFNKTDNENSMLHSNKGTDIEKSFSEIIDFIRYICTETFTIESESDIKRIKQEAEIALCNGEIIIAKKRTFSQFCIIYHKDKRHPCEKLWIESLKGATVTQSRGEK